VATAFNVSRITRERYATSLERLAHAIFQELEDSRTVQALDALGRLAAVAEGTSKRMFDNARGVFTEFSLIPGLGPLPGGGAGLTNGKRKESKTNQELSSPKIRLQNANKGKRRKSKRKANKKRQGEI